MIDVADAVVTELNNVFASSFTVPAIRQNIPRNNLEDLSVLRVTVRPKDKVTSRATRSIVQDIVRVYVGIQKQCPVDDDNSLSDPLIDLGEDIQAYFDKQIPLTALPGVVCENSAFGADGDSTWMSVVNKNTIDVYTGLIVLTFRVARPGRQPPA